MSKSHNLNHPSKVVKMVDVKISQRGNEVAEE